MLNDVLIGTLLSIPIGIGTGLAVAPIERWRENRGKTRGLAKSRWMRQEYVETLNYVRHPHVFTQYLLHKLIDIVSSVGMIVLGMSLALGAIMLLHPHGILSPTGKI